MGEPILATVMAVEAGAEAGGGVDLETPGTLPSSI
jgi:hypothetical protein